MRVVVFAGPALYDSTVEAIEALALALPDARFLVVEAGNPLSRRRWLRGKWRRLRREPLSYPLELLSELPGRLRRSRQGSVTAGVGLPRLEDGALSNVEVARFDRLHGDRSLAAIRAFAPWLGISIGAPILREPLFTIPQLGTINLHKSMLPEYRGMPSGFWELHDGTTVGGVSVHWVEKGLDTGEVLRQAPTAIDPYTTPAGLLARLDALSIDVLVGAVTDLVSGEAGSQAQGEARTPTRRRPAFLVNRRVRRRTELARRPRRGAAARLRELVKAALMRGFVCAWAPLRNRWRGRRGACHTTVLLYHRVSDEFLDRVTVGIEQFQGHLRLLRQRYDVLDMPTYLATRGQRRTRPAVVLTFDDGYQDNHLAARLLRREGLPCTFFISTRIVGSELAFEHDVRKVGKRVPPLNWSQVQEMDRWGFGFGNHTAHHVDCGSLPLDDALEEIRVARGDLLERLGSAGPERWFAFPFGREENITEDVCAALPDLGIDYCLSAYGGVNPPDFERWNIRRSGISQNVSDIGLRAIIEGWGARG